MAIMTKEQFQASIRARKPMNVWFLGEKVDDLTAFPPLAASFNAISKVYELHSHPDWVDLVTTKSALNGETVSIYNAPLASPADANKKTRAARALAERCGALTAAPAPRRLPVWVPAPTTWTMTWAPITTSAL